MQPRTDRNDDGDDLLVDVRRYRSLTRRGRQQDSSCDAEEIEEQNCPSTPPLAVFLSSEDITSTIFPLRHAIFTLNHIIFTLLQTTITFCHVIITLHHTILTLDQFVTPSFRCLTPSLHLMILFSHSLYGSTTFLHCVTPLLLFATLFPQSVTPSLYSVTFSLHRSRGVYSGCSPCVKCVNSQV